MARKTIEKNIALDDERELYYVTLQWGKNKDGKYEKTTKTAHSKKEASLSSRSWIDLRARLSKEGLSSRNCMRRVSRFIF